MMRYLICCAAIVCNVLSVRAQHSSLLPVPKHLSYQAGSLAVPDLSLPVLQNVSADTRFSINELKAFLAKYPGTKTKAASFKYEISSSTPADSSVGQQSYSLSINEKGINIRSATTTGFYYAIQTLKQLVERVNGKPAFPFVTISDTPSIQYRGVMMDFAHGGLLSVAEIKRQIDFLARWKTNQYYFYNEVSIALEGYESMNYEASYSPAQIREIVKYGRERHMDVIPFVAFYGHLHDLLKQEKYASLAIGHYGHELDPRNPEVKNMLRDWIKQYASMFTSPFIHVGFDETWETNRIASETSSSVNSEELWLEHLGFVSQELKKYGKKVLAWTDMSSYYPDIMDKFPKDVTPVIWEYAPDTAALNHYLNPVLSRKRQFFIQSAVSGWGHAYPAAAYTYDNIDLCLEAGMKYQSPAYITSVWTDAVEPLVRPSWMFMAYGCIGAWQGVPPERSSFESNYSKIEFSAVGNDLAQAFSNINTSLSELQKCLGANTSNMPGGTIIESWSNPFSKYYLDNTHKHESDFKNARRASEEARSLLLHALAHCNAQDSEFIRSLLVTTKIIHYTTSRFLWASVICQRWNESMINRKKNDFVYYDISYLCHGLIQDMMDENGELKTSYQRAWLAESMPYRLNTILGKFDVEFAFWQKLLLKVVDHRIAHEPDYVAGQPFEELFRPDF